MISNRCYYALKATLELAKREGGGLVTIAEIARSQRIPSRFLEAILLQLKQAGYAQSVRGKEGGYLLAKPAAKITVAHILYLFEGPLLAVAATDEENKRSGQTDIFEEVWKKAESATSAILDKMTFRDLAEKDKLRASHSVSNYVI